MDYSWKYSFSCKLAAKCDSRNKLKDYLWFAYLFIHLYLMLLFDFLFVAINSAVSAITLQKNCTVTCTHNFILYNSVELIKSFHEKIMQNLKLLILCIVLKGLKTSLYALDLVKKSQSRSRVQKVDN